MKEPLKSAACRIELYIAEISHEPLTCKAGCSGCFSGSFSFTSSRYLLISVLRFTIFICLKNHLVMYNTGTRCDIFINRAACFKTTRFQPHLWSFLRALKQNISELLR